MMNRIKYYFEQAFYQILGITVTLLCFWGTIIIHDALADSINEIQVSLGNPAGELKFIPHQLEFTAGQKYKLVLYNPSPSKHYFTAKDFADASWTQKVEAGKVEVKGAIHELELKPSAQAEWVLVPMKPGTYKLYCSIAGHAEAGMVGKLIVNP